MSDYLTTKELAELLRIKERKVYDLAASGEIPCSRAMGKLLFPRRAVEAWLAESSTGFEGPTGIERPNVFLGSHDPLLEWALRESRCGLATFFDSSLDGLDRFGANEGIATSLHVLDAASGDWNVGVVRERFERARVVLAEFAWRERGLVLPRGKGSTITGLARLKGKRFAPRQPQAGSQQIFEHLLSQSGLGPDDITLAAVSRTESDAALAIQAGKADATFGLRTLANQHGLDFVPVVKERFDLLVDRRSWFEPPMQALLEFCRGETFAEKAGEFAGYDVSGFGRVHFNGA